MNTFRKNRMKYFNITLALLFALLGAIFLFPPPQNASAACNPPYLCVPAYTKICESGSLSCSLSGGGTDCPGTEFEFTATASHTPGKTTETWIDECCVETNKVTDNDEITDFNYEWSVTPDAPRSGTGDKVTYTPTTCGVYTVSVTIKVNECPDQSPLTCTASTTFTAEDEIAPVLSDVSTLTNIIVDCHSDIPEAPTLTATDNCASGIDVVYLQVPSTITDDVCSYTRTWSAVDSCNNVTSLIQEITVVSDPPVLTGVPEDITINCPDDMPTNDVVTATQCDRSWTVDYEDEPEDWVLACSNVVIRRTWTAVGYCSGETNETQEITYKPPELYAPSYEKTSIGYEPGFVCSNPCEPLEWILEIKENDCDSEPVKAEIDSSTGVITVADDSGSGTVTVTVTDPGTGCEESVDVEIGCSACGASGSCSAGSSTAEACSWMFKINLGYAARNTPAGALVIYTSVPTPETATPAGLRLSARTRTSIPINGNSFAAVKAASGCVEPIYDINGLRQIWAPECLTDIVVETPFKYRIDIYDAGRPYLMTFAIPIRADDTLHVFNNNLIVSYTVENPNGAASFDTLHITENRPGDDPKTTVFGYDSIGFEGTSPSWSISEGDDSKIVSLSIKENATEKIIYRTVSSQVATASQSIITKKNFPWGFSTVEYAEGSGAESRINTYSYYTTAGNASYGKKKLIVNADGSWQRFDSYDSEARKAVVVSSWGNQDVDASAADAKSTYYSYAPVDGQDTITERKDTPRTTTVKIENKIVSKTYNAYYLNAANQRVEITAHAHSASAPYDDMRNQRTTTIYNPDGTDAGSRQVSSRTTSDGKLDTYSYDNGTWTFNNSQPGQSTFTVDGGTYTRVTIDHVTTNSPDGIANKTTRDITIQDGLGKTVMRETRLCTGNKNYDPIAIAWTVYENNGLGETSVQYNSNGTKTETVMASCGCGTESETDAQGLTTEYQYDALNRLDFTSKELGGNVVITTNSYDAAGRRLTSKTTAGSLTQTTSSTYDSTGRHKTSTDNLEIVTTYGYSPDGLTSTVARAGITNTTVRYLDGRTHYTKQNGETKQTYEYGVNSDGTQWSTNYIGGLASSVWSATTTDFLGRTKKTERPGFGGAILVSETFYNTDGTVDYTTSTGSPDTIYDYDELGQRFRTAQDINDNGNIDLTSYDIVNDSHTIFEKDTLGKWWQKSYQVLYPHDNSTPVTNGISRTRLTGFDASRTTEIDGASYTALVVGERVAEDIRGNKATSLQLLNRDQKLSIALSITPASTPESTLTNAAITVAGLQSKTISSTGIVTTNWYDNIGRRIMSGNLSADVLQSNPSTIEQLESAVAASSNRNTYNLTGYNSKGQVEWTCNAASNTTWFAYNDVGQRYATIRSTGDTPVSLTSTQLADEAYVLGLLNNENFSIAYTAYSPEGQTLATYGNAYPVAYEYDDQNRMIAMATTRDEALRKVNLLSQLPAGETLSTWQPTENDKIDITKWEYDSATGLLTDKLYSDGRGPSYTYTSTGKLETRTWARGITTDYLYNYAGAITNVTYGDNTTPNVAYTYNRLGQQLSAITSVSTNTFVYSPITFELDYELQNGIKIDRSTDTLGRNNGYELFNLVDLVNPVQKITYGFDTFSRFAAVTSRVDNVTNSFIYSYSPGSSLLSGYTVSTPSTASTLLTVSRTYELNRNLITAITNSVGSVPSVVDAFTYHNDALGRRTQRSDYHDDGNNPSTTANTFGYNTFSEVTNAVMGSNAHSYKYDPIGNRNTSELNGDSDNYLANGLNQYTNITYGQTLVAPSFDTDGNMLTNATHSFTWDAENRLLTASNLTTAVVASYTYDHQSRRIFKKVVNSAVITQHSLFTYDGWNLIYEASTSSTVSTNLYVWGLDLSGSLQGAGGVGGLLSQTIITPTTASSYFPLADANGNAVTYVDNAGNVQAHYIYDAFGGTVSQSGDMDDTFRFRFSSKYFDDETGFYYYGYRYYDPATGRWLSRDPIGKRGGDNLYGFVGNDGVNGIDMLGMWEIKREREAYAIAKVSSESDTFDSLAKLLRLDTSDYKTWAHTKDERPCGEYKIPNTIYYHHGALKWFWESWRNNIIGSWRRQNRSRAVKDRAKKFKVVLEEDITDGEIKTALKDEYLYEYTFSGHGTGQGQINAFNSIGVEANRYTKYGIKLLTLQACNSAAKDGKAGNEGYHKYNRWEWNVAKRGWIIGYTGRVKLWDEIFLWRITRGINKKK